MHASVEIARALPALADKSPALEPPWVWIQSHCFFSRSDARQHCWLWLRSADGCVHALRLPAGLHGDEQLARRWQRELAAVPFAADVLESEGAVALPDAPIVPLTRWAVSWGHPVQHAIRAFAAALDQAVLDTLGWLETAGSFFGSVQHYNRLAMLPPRLREHRLQALRRFPSLVTPLLVGEPGHPDMFGDDYSECDDPAPTLSLSAVAAVDAGDHGRDLTGALAAHYRISRALARSPLLSQPWATGHIAPDVLRLLQAMPPQAWPLRAADVECRLDALRALPVRRMDESDSVELAHAFAGGWNATWHALEARAPGRLQPALHDCADFLRAALQDGALPEALAGMDESALGLAWVRRLGLVRLLDASLRWHGQAAVTVPAAGDGLPDKIAPLLERRDWQGEGSALELATRQALHAEGQSMHHCVGGYWPICLLKSARIFHLHADDGEQATAMYELGDDAQDPHFALAQLRGPRNKEPGAALRRLARTLELELNAPSLREQRLAVNAQACGWRDGLRQRFSQPVQHLRTLDARTRAQLQRVLDWCARQPQWHCARQLAYRGNIAGFGYADGPRLMGRLQSGDALQLVRERDNPHDRRAVRIDWNGNKLGYVPRVHNPVIAQALDAGNTLHARIIDLDPSRGTYECVSIEIRSEP